MALGCFFLKFKIWIWISNSNFMGGKPSFFNFWGCIGHYLKMRVVSSKPSFRELFEKEKKEYGNFSESASAKFYQCVCLVNTTWMTPMVYATFSGQKLHTKNSKKISFSGKFSPKKIMPFFRVELVRGLQNPFWQSLG